MKNSISKPVLAFIAACITLVIVVLWFGPNPNKKKAEPAAAPAVAGQTAANPVSTIKPAPESETTDGLPAVIPISLTNVLDEAEKSLALTDTSVQALPQGTQVYGGIEFWLQGMIHLQGLATRDDEHRNFRTRIIVPLDQTNITAGEVSVTHPGSNIATIYLLGGARYSSRKEGEKFADVILHYGDGSISRNEVKYNVHLRDWWRIPYEDPVQLPNALTKVAWKGPYPTPKDHSLRLYRIAFINPYPEKVISSIEFASTMARPSLFVSALTLDPLALGTRPDDLTSQEMVDPELNGQLLLFVQDTEGHPLADAQVSSSFKSASGSASGHKYTTDNTGMALVRFPDSGLETLDVSAEHDDYSGRKMLWDLQSSDILPASYTLKLAGEIKIGGLVVDSGANPIPGAVISLNRFWTGSDGSPDKKGEQPSFSYQEQTTDDQGRWQAKGLPPGLLDHIMFDVKHPDFVSTNINVTANAATEKQLRDGTLKIVLLRGLDVHGQVVDENDNPVSGATVWAGRKYYRDRQETQSDDQGRFSFHNVKDGNTLFSVMAKDHSPDSKTVNVHADMSEVVFKLKTGSVIRAQVQDESGQPVADAHAGLEGSPGESAYDAYEFSANTDSQGNFTWDSAPDEPMPFYIYHEGFEAKRGVKLAPGQDNTVTMHPSRQVQGQVLNDTTDLPVTNFTVRTGTASADNSDVYGVIRNREFSAIDGRFTLSIDEESDNAIFVNAGGYADQVQKMPDAQNGTVQMVVRLKPSAGLSGVVLAPDGSPAPGVNVAVSGDPMHSNIQLSDGRLRSYDTHSRIATTDADGKFNIPSVPDDGTVVAAGEPGFGRNPLAEVRNSGTITLQLWGRIEGTFKIGGQPGVGKDFLFNLSIPGIGTDFNGYKSTTDDQGQFTMEKVPPGEGAIVRLIKTAEASWTWSDSTPVTVKPGETTQVTLGGNGATLARCLMEKRHRRVLSKPVI
jgi:protocatechuate 3,4-dioxygenase beta subunit